MLPATSSLSQTTPFSSLSCSVHTMSAVRGAVTRLSVLGQIDSLWVLEAVEGYPPAV